MPNADPYKPDAPGWYPDPWSATGQGERYFDGRAWGSSERPRGRHSTEAAPTATKVRHRVRLARTRPVVVLALVVAASTAYWFFAQSGDDSAETASGIAHPPAGAGASPRRLLPVRQVPPAEPGSFVYLQNQEDDAETPVAFDPCRPIHYTVNPAGAPADGDALVTDAIATLQRATGLKFVNDGGTDEAESRNRAPYQPDRYRDDRWAPVLISWSDERQFPTLAGFVAGAGRPQSVSGADGRSVYVTGSVVLDRDDLAPEETIDRNLVRATILHELGHLVGLDHTADRSQLMFSEAQIGHTDYASGDLHGLAVLGAQACFPAV